jgi:hypothetical protein
MTNPDRLWTGHRDVDGDKQPDVLLADKKQFVWYRNPGSAKAGDAAAWTKFILAENLTKNDNVCIAAQDIDGDGKCEVAVGAEWNPGDTVNSGAVFYLIPPADRTQKWEPVKFPSVEPTTHRMKWVRLGEREWGLVVVPLHGRGNKTGEGAPVKVLLYHPPTPLNDPKGEWKSEVIDESMHMAHNFDPAKVAPDFHGNGLKLVLGGREGMLHLRKRGDELLKIWLAQNAGNPNDCVGVGEVRGGQFHGSEAIAAIEPMHGNQLVFYSLSKPGDDVKSQRHALTDKLTEGHALACGDLLGVKSDQIVVGWRGTPGKEGSTFGVHVWTPLDEKGEQWRDTAVDDTGMSCEDLQLADLDRDGKLDIIASGRATKNVKIYFNETPR